LQEWTTPDSRNTVSTTNLVEEEIVDAVRNHGNASLPEQVKRPNPWRKMMMKMMVMMMMMIKDNAEIHIAQITFLSMSAVIVALSLTYPARSGCLKSALPLQSLEVSTSSL